MGLKILMYEFMDENSFVICNQKIRPMKAAKKITLINNRENFFYDKYFPKECNDFFLF